MLALHLDLPAMPILQQILGGLCRTAPTARVRLPITLPLLHFLKLYFAQSPFNLFDQHCLWACCSLAFFGCFRIGEILPTPAGNNIQSVDVAIQGNTIRMLLRHSKTDKFAKGTEIHIKAIDSPLCPVSALSHYLPHRIARYPAGPIFILSSGRPLSTFQFNLLLKAAFRTLGLAPSRYSSHSFRAGAATTAATAGLPDWMIKALGRWASEAYHIYINPPLCLTEIPNLLTN